MSHFILAIAVVLCLLSCRPARKEPKPVLPFDNELALFTGSFRTPETDYKFQPEGSYRKSITHYFGNVEERGTFKADAVKDIITFTPQRFRCFMNQQVKTLPSQEFQAILRVQKDNLINAYQQRIDDPDGLKALLKKFEEAKYDGEESILAREISKEIAKNNIDSLEGYLDFLDQLKKDIIQFEDQVIAMQVQIDKKQKEVDIANQEMINALGDRTEAKAKVVELVTAKNGLISKKHQLIATRDRFQNKMKFLLREYPLSKKDLDRALAGLRNIENYMTYLNNRQIYLDEATEFILKMVLENEKIIRAIEAYVADTTNPHSYYFKINSQTLSLDHGPINAASPKFDQAPDLAPTETLADCSQAALIVLTKYLEIVAKIPPYKPSP